MYGDNDRKKKTTKILRKEASNISPNKERSSVQSGDVTGFENKVSFYFIFKDICFAFCMSLLILSEDGLGCSYLYEFMSLYRVSTLGIVFPEMVLMFLLPCLFRDCVLVMGTFKSFEDYSSPNKDTKQPWTWKTRSLRCFTLTFIEMSINEISFSSAMSFNKD